VVEVILLIFKLYVRFLQHLDLLRDFLYSVFAKIWQQQFWVKLFLKTSVEFFLDLTVLLKEFTYSLFVKLVGIFFSPIFEVTLGFAENSVYDQGFKLLIMGCPTLCDSSNSLDNNQGFGEHRFFILDALAEFQ
jgi:hypothetical protein